MSYFRELPNIEYPNIVDPQAALNDYQVFKNIFTRGKVEMTYRISLQSFRSTLYKTVNVLTRLPRSFMVTPH